MVNLLPTLYWNFSASITIASSNPSKSKTSSFVSSDDERLPVQSPTDAKLTKFSDAPKRQIVQNTTLNYIWTEPIRMHIYAPQLNKTFCAKCHIIYSCTLTTEFQLCLYWLAVKVTFLFQMNCVELNGNIQLSKVAGIARVEVRICSQKQVMSSSDKINLARNSLSSKKITQAK